MHNPSIFFLFYIICGAYGLISGSVQRRRFYCPLGAPKGSRHFIGEECCDRRLAKIIGNAFRGGGNRTMDEALKATQKRAEVIYGTSFEAINSPGRFVASSHYRGKRSCKVRMGQASVLLYETPLQQNVLVSQTAKRAGLFSSEVTSTIDKLVERSWTNPPLAKWNGVQGKRRLRQSNNVTFPEGTHCDHSIRTGNKCCNGLLYLEVLKALDTVPLQRDNRRRLGKLSYLIKEQAQQILGHAMEVIISGSNFAMASYHVGDNICKFKQDGLYFLVYENPQQRQYNVSNVQSERVFNLHDSRDSLGTKESDIVKPKQMMGLMVEQSGERAGFPMGSHCTEDRTGSRCCNLMLFHAIDKAMGDVQRARGYNPTDRRKMATAIRNAAETVLGVTMEVIVASDDFVFSSHSDDTMCKIQAGDYHIMVYATPPLTQSYPMFWDQYNDIGKQSKLSCDPYNITSLEGFACCHQRLHFQLLKTTDLNSERHDTELSREVATTVQGTFDTRFETVTSRSDFVWSTQGRENRYCKLSINGVHVLTFQSSYLRPLPNEFVVADVVQVPLIESLSPLSLSELAAIPQPFVPNIVPNFAPPQFAPPQFGPGQFGPGQFGPGQFGPGQFGPGQFGPGQFGTGQAGVGQGGYSGYGQNPQQQSSSSGTGAAAGSCFSRDTWVMTPMGKRRIDQIQIGDFVLSASESKSLFSPVTQWLHREEDIEAVFVNIVTDKGKRLKLTPKHLIMSSTCSDTVLLPKLEEAVFADELVEGDCLYVFDEDDWTLQRIIEASRSVERGIYSPLTANGKIIVNDILASCYSNIKNTQLQNSYFEFVFLLRSFFKFMEETVSQQTVTLPFSIGLVDSLYDLVIPQSSLLF